MKRRSNLLVGGALVALGVFLASCGSQFLAGGKLHYAQERYPQALENFEKAVAEQPNNGEAHLWLGRALAMLERDDEAVVEIHKAGELDPLQQEMVDNTLKSFWSKRYNSGLMDAQNAVGEDGDKKRAELEAARERFDRAIIFAPDSVSNYSNLGKVLYQLGRVDEAMAMFDKSRDMSAGRPDLQKFLFELYRGFGLQALQMQDPQRADLERALTLFHDAETVPESPEDMADVNYNMATAYYSLVDKVPEEEQKPLLEKAAEYYQKVLEFNPEDADALESLAYVYSDLGMHEKAIETGQKRYDLAPWTKESNLLMHRLYKAAGDDKLANGHILLVQILDSPRQPLSDIRAEAQKFGPGSDILKVLRDRGEPQEVRAFTVGQTPYTAWFFWSDGRVYIFRDGQEQVRITFKPVTGEQLKEILQ